MSNSIISRSSGAFDVFSVCSRPSIKIDLNEQTEGMIPSYTTGDRIEGTATITSEYLISFDEIDITLEGTSTASVERGALPGRTGAAQTFLRLRQPIEETAYPMPRVLELGRTYQFPFTFVVPERLLPHVCSHQKTNAHVEHSHTFLPPTLGDPMLASNGKSLLDDLSPDMCRISYQIRVNIVRKPVPGSGPSKSLGLSGKKIRIIPAIEEEPPLTVLDTDPVYRVRKEKDVKRGTMRPKQGRLVVAASQPKPLQLNPPNSEICESVSTAATIHLRFDPVGNEEPPSLGSVWSKLRVSTYYSVHPWQDYPTTSTVSSLGQLAQGLYYETVPLSTLCVASAQWTKHTNGDLARRDSLQSTSSNESLTGPSASFAGSTYYSASVVVPVTLPKTKAFVPTFHSCLVSRVYTLELSISYHTPHMNILTPTASLKIPIQLTCRPRPRSDADIRGSQNITQEEVNAAFFSPRSVAPPTVFAPEVSRTEAPPPEYSNFFPSPARGVPCG